MNRAATLRRAWLALLATLLGAGASSSCYRAEIDLGLLAPAAASGGMGGEANEACDETPLASEYESCRLRLPTMAECSEQDPDGWSGCYSGGCAVCTESVVDYPYYFDWHPCCLANTTCNSNDPVKCNARCPPPTEHDQLRPCWLVEVTP